MQQSAKIWSWTAQFSLSSLAQFRFRMGLAIFAFPSLKICIFGCLQPSLKQICTVPAPCWRESVLHFRAGVMATTRLKQWRTPRLSRLAVPRTVGWDVQGLVDGALKQTFDQRVQLATWLDRSSNSWFSFTSIIYAKRCRSFTLEKHICI